MYTFANWWKIILFKLFIQNHCPASLIIARALWIRPNTALRSDTSSKVQLRVSACTSSGTSWFSIKYTSSSVFQTFAFGSTKMGLRLVALAILIHPRYLIPIRQVVWRSAILPHSCGWCWFSNNTNTHRWFTKLLTHSFHRFDQLRLALIFFNEAK